MLPAKLTPIEEYFLLDDCPAYPMTVLVRLRLAGRLNPEAFETAVKQVVDRHPLLGARVQVAGETRRWVDCPEWQPHVEWDVDCKDASWPTARYIDVREEPGTRFSVVHREEYDEVIIQAHHCCSDGLGLCRLTEDLLVAYANAYRDLCDHVEGTSSHATRKVNSQRFSRRGMPGMPRWMFMMMLHRSWARFSHCMSILRDSCSQLLPDKTPRPRDQAMDGYPAVRVIRFDQEQTQKIVKASKAKAVTVNSILLRDLFLAIRDWRSELGVNQKDDTLRFCVPVDLRTQRDLDLTVANSISLLFLDRNESQLQCEQSLLDSVQDELHNKARQDFRISFVTMLQVGRHLPGGLKKFLSDRRCWSTCIFSSLGVLFRDVVLPDDDGCLVAGNVRMEQWDLVPPLRDNLGLTICPYTYAGRMSVVFHYDPTRINGEQLAMMLQTYLSRLEKSIGTEQGELCAVQEG